MMRPAASCPARTLARRQSEEGGELRSLANALNGLARSSALTDAASFAPIASIQRRQETEAVAGSGRRLGPAALPEGSASVSASRGGRTTSPHKRLCRLARWSPSRIQPGARVEMAIARHCGLFQTLWVVSAAPDALAVTPVSRPFVFSAVSLIYQIDIKVLRSSVLYA